MTENQGISEVLLLGQERALVGGYLYKHVRTAEARLRQAEQDTPPSPAQPTECAKQQPEYAKQQAGQVGEEKQLCHQLRPGSRRATSAVARHRGLLDLLAGWPQSPPPGPAPQVARAFQVADRGQDRSVAGRVCHAAGRGCQTVRVKGAACFCSSTQSGSFSAPKPSNTSTSHVWHFPLIGSLPLP